MNQEDILKMARAAGFKANSFSPVIARHTTGYFVDMLPEVERFAALVAAKAEQDERQKHQADIERWKGEAAKAEKWRGLALAKDGDGRTVQRIQQEAAKAARESIASHYAQQPHVEFFGAELADEIRARGR